MVAKLVVEEGDLKGLTLSLEQGDTWIVGRDPAECQLVIEDPLVSRRHLLARRTPEGIIVENLSETNPAQINDEEMNKPSHLLQNGDTLKIGNELLRYYEDSSAHILDEETPETELEKEYSEIEADEETPSETKEEKEAPAQAASSVSAIPSSQENPSTQSSVFGEDEADLATLAEIDFGVVEIGRWLLKVIGGPNNGAEFYMQAGNSYILGTDPQSSDIVFHDTSVSRQHAKITVTPEDILLIEDLKSRNGVLMGGVTLEGEQTLNPNTIVALGTTSFVVYDREGEMQTIISPLLPSIVKVLQQEPSKTETPPPPIAPEPVAAAVETPLPVPPSKPPRQWSPYIITTAIIALFVLAGVGTTSLFHSEPVIVQTQENADEPIQQALKPFSAVRYTFNKTNGGLLLLGHVSTLADKNQLLYNLQGLKFIKSIDDKGIIIDEYVWNEVNSLFAENTAWKGIRIHSPAAGQFILSGYLQTRKQADQLSAYISLNFPYLDLLKKEIVVEEDVVNQIQNWLQNAQLFDVVPKMTHGEIGLTGTVPTDKVKEFNDILAQIKQIPGVRIVNNLVRSQTAETGTIDLSDHYQVTGKSRIGNKYTVVINGRILSEDDDLDGMNITNINPDRVLLEKDGVKYRIDY